MDLIDLLKRPEGKTLEFKRDLSSPEGVLRALVAFANTAVVGGHHAAYTLCGEATDHGRTAGEPDQR